MNLETAIAIFLAPLKTTTANSYRYALEPFQRYIGPARPLESIGPQHIAEYATVIQQSDYAVATRLKHAKTVRVFFNWCVKQGLIESSPARIWKMPRVPQAITREKAMTDTELGKLLEYLRWKPRHYATVMFIADTGCRISGAATLKEEHLDLDNLRATVIEKGDKTRLVIYGPATGNAIRAWLIRRPKNAGPYVFSRDGKPFNAKTISQMIRRACQKVGVRTLSGHSLRHRKGHQLADAHVPISIAATALGHSDPNTTLKHYYPADWETAEREMRNLALKPKEMPDAPANIVKFPNSRSS